ncbi:MAG: cytochrome b [Bdellovibrionales bacterium]
MPKAKTPWSYDGVAKTLHWLIAFSVIGMLALGWIMTGLENSPNKFALFQWHKSIGITILLLSVIRLIWRLMHPRPPYPAHMPEWEKMAARATHFIFYVLIIGMPLTGWAMVSSSSFALPTMLYGYIEWPHMPILPALENKKEISHLFGEAHELAAFLFVPLIGLHIAAAHKHHWFDKDDILIRMAPGPVARLLVFLRGGK